MKYGASGVNAMASPAISTRREVWRIGGPEHDRFLQVIHASLAKKVLRRDQLKNRFPRKREDYLRVVDGRLGAYEESVRYGGRIIYQNNSEEVSAIYVVLAWVAERLVRYSPYRNKRPIDNSLGGYRKQHYEDAHLYMVDGRSVMTIDSRTTIIGFRNTFQTAKHLKGSKHVFINTMPYARRMEHGGGYSHTTKSRTTRSGRVTAPRTSKMKWSMQAPTGVYLRVVREAKARFGETVNIKYSRFQLNLPHTVVNRKLKIVGQWYPAIVIRPKEVTRGLDPA